MAIRLREKKILLTHFPSGPRGLPSHEAMVIFQCTLPVLGRQAKKRQTIIPNSPPETVDDKSSKNGRVIGLKFTMARAVGGSRTGRDPPPPH